MIAVWYSQTQATSTTHPRNSEVSSKNYLIFLMFVVYCESGFLAVKLYNIEFYLFIFPNVTVIVLFFSSWGKSYCFTSLPCYLFSV